MTDIIICNASLEPLGFFDEPHVGTRLSVAAALSYDCRKPAPAGSTPKELFEAVLKALPDATFRIYRFVEDPLPPAPPPPAPPPPPAAADAPKTGKLQLAGDWTAVVDNVPSENTPVANVLAWLERRGQSEDGGAAPDDYWLSEDQPVSGEFKLIDLKATQYLATSAAWPAPLPQDAGLVRIVRLASPADDASKKDLLLVPFFADAAEQDDLPATLHNGIVSFDYDAGKKNGEYDFSDAKGEGRFLVEPAPDATSLVDPKTTFLFAPQDAEQADRTIAILKRIEERSPSLFWAFPPIQGILWPEDKENINRLVWRAMNGLAALLDPVVLSLTMPRPPRAKRDTPSSSPDPEGPFIAALAASVENVAPSGKTTEIATRVRGKVESKLRDITETDDADRQNLVTLLGSLFDIDLTPANVSVATARGVIPLLLNEYTAHAPEALTEPRWLGEAQTRFGPLELALSAELARLAQQMQSEDGIERIAVALFETFEVIDTPGHLATLVAIDEDDAQEAISGFRTFIAQNFNGLDAARHAQARLFEEHVVAADPAVIPPAPGAGPPAQLVQDDFETRLAEADWFARRVTKPRDGRFSELRKVLPVYAEAALSANDLTYLVETKPGDTGSPKAGALKRAWFVTEGEEGHDQAVCTELLDTVSAKRFVPDTSPRALPIQLAVDSDTTDIDNFADTYNGVGVLVRRKGGAWAYANLAELAQRKPLLDQDSYGDYTGATVLPLQPVAIDGQRRLFLEYDGLPFTSDAFVDTRTPAISPEEVKRPFFVYRDPPREKLGGKARLPALAYGKSFEVAAFVVSKGGSLPKALQADEKMPWTPVDTPGEPDAAFVRQHEYYSRRTAVGRVTITETPDRGGRARIGVAIDGVQPLSRDYPRVGFVAEAGRSAAHDLLRNGDGTGAFGLPGDKATTRLALSNLWWWGGKGELVVSLYSDPGAPPDAAPDVKWTFGIDSPFAGSTLTLEISGVESAENSADRILTLTCRLSSGGQPPLPHETQEVKADAAGTPAILSVQSVWLRIGVKGGTDAVALSLADPLADATADGATTRPTMDGLVLIAPPSGEWRAPYDKPVTGAIVFPRVGFNDFDRWLNNSELAGLAKKSGSGSAADDEKQFASFRSMVMTAYVGRHVDDRLAPLVDNLPDLSVDQLLVELTPLDALDDAPSKVVSRKLPKISHVIALRTLGARLSTLPDMDDYKKTANNLRALSESYSAIIEISALDTGDLSIKPVASHREFKLEIGVPRGVSARLTIRPMVQARHLIGADAVFNAGIATLATEIRDGYYIFEGASLIVEAMLGALARPKPEAEEPKQQPWQGHFDPELNRRSVDWENLVAAAIDVRPAGVHRSYDLVSRSSSAVAAANGWWWRQLASIDIQTQRWRFTGRPIYSWLDPKKNANGSAHLNVAIKQTAADAGAFEAEAFFDRDDQDADTQTMRLSPAPDDTVLQSFPWEQPSATYFRHRLRIRSRYEGALRSGAVATLRAWGADVGKNGGDPESDARSWIRVAMLADRTRLQLTRPQLRALIPLTLAPNADETSAATPPVMAVLDERPFAHGGLADRIAAEVRTGLGYELPPEPHPLRIKDARKEFGPDPRLTYTPTSEADAYAVALESEGPVGLTFDSDSVRAPVFANTALVLHPTMLTETGAPPASLEEHFLSVGLRRYLDPSWLTDDTTAASAPVDIAKTWWIELPEKNWSFKPMGANDAVVGGKLDAGLWTVEFNPRAIDSEPSGKDDDEDPPPPVEWKTLCNVRASRAGRLALLHLPLEKGRASLSVFALPSGNGSGSDVAAGTSNLPLMLASLEWQVPTGATTLELKGGKALPTSASPTTLLNWTRTGKNFELWHASRNGEFVPWSASEVVASRKEGEEDYVFLDRTDRQHDLSFEPPSSRYPNPLYVHRHHAVIATGKADGIGRPVEVFKTAFRTFGDALALPSNRRIQTVRLVEFETPAQPLAFFGAPPQGEVLKALQTAHFDLYSLLGDAKRYGRRVPTGFSLFIRPLGGDVTNSKLTQLELSLKLALNLSLKLLPQEGPSSTVTVDIERPAADADAVLRGILLAVSNATDPASVTSQSIFAGGAVGDPTSVRHTLPKFDLTAVTAVELGIAGLVPAGMAEFWTDVSLLTLADGDTGGRALDFGWFFSGGEFASPGEAVAEPALRDMVEAQARIIAVSPPMKVEG